MTKAHMAMLAAENKKLEQAGLYRPETIHPGHVVDFTTQDYLGLARHERVLAAARAALDKHGLGLRSSRALTGTREIHRELEQAIARFLQVPDAIVLGSGYLANLGLYEALFDSRDCLFCDALVHPSTAEGVRLSSATAFPFRNNDADDLEDKLRRSRSARFRAIVTDGVFPFDGRVAELEGICALAEKYDAMVVLDDSLGVGVLGETGRGTRELRGVIPRIDVVTGTFGKALGGAGGGYVAGKREVIELAASEGDALSILDGAVPAARRRGPRGRRAARARRSTARDAAQPRCHDEEGARAARLQGPRRASVARRAGRRCRRVAEARQPTLRARHPCQRSLLSRRAGRPGADPARAQRTHSDQDMTRVINAFDLAGRALGVI